MDGWMDGGREVKKKQLADKKFSLTLNDEICDL